jgi:hypothetical protein
MVTYEKHIINLSFQSVSHIDYYLSAQEERYGKMEILSIDGAKMIARYADHYGYIAARQSNRWSNKKIQLWKSNIEW